MDDKEVNMKKTSVLMVFAMFFLLASSLGTGRERQGAQVVVTMKSGVAVEGELIAVKRDFLAVSSSGWGEVSDQSIAVKDVREVKVIRRSKAALGAFIGLLAGAGGGALLGSASGNDRSGLIQLSSSEKAGLFAFVFGVTGLTVGVIAGALSGADESFSLENKSGQVVSSTLSRLSDYARIKGIQ
jgi:hypothetical protein